MSKSLDELSPKKLQELEVLTEQLLSTMKRTPLQHEPIFEELTRLEAQLSRIRRARFDDANPTFKS
mgnify:CR=1 FL=1